MYNGYMYNFIAFADVYRFELVSVTSKAKYTVDLHCKTHFTISDYSKPLLQDHLWIYSYWICPV